MSSSDSNSFITPLPSFQPFQGTAYVPPILQKIPDDLVRWLIEDISKDNLQKILAAQAFKDRLEGCRPNAFPKEKAHQLLIQEFKAVISFRTFLGGLWKEQRKEDVKALDAVPSERFPEMRGDLVRRYGLPFVYWYGLFSEKVVLQKTAVRAAAEFSSRPGTVPEEVRSAHDSELRRLKEELSEARSENKQLAMQAEAGNQWARKLQAEAESLKDQSAQGARRLEAEKERAETLKGQIGKLEEKIRSLSDAEHTIRSLEKTQKALEHELKSARKEAGEEREALEGLRRSMEEIESMKAEMERTVSACFAALSGKKVSPGGASGGTVLVIGESKSLAPEYYQGAGGQVLYRSGFKKDADLEKMVKKADRAVLFVSKWEDSGKYSDLVGFLRKSEVPFVILPVLSPEQFAAFLSVRS